MGPATAAPPMGGFNAAMSSNSFNGYFPMGRLPAKPNPLANATPPVHGLADTQGVQAAMAKRAALKRSATGDVKRELRFNKGIGQVGQEAWDSLDSVMRKTGADAFSVAFFSGLHQQGKTKEQVEQCIKQAADHCGADVGELLTRDMEKMAGWFSQAAGTVGRGLSAAKGGIAKKLTAAGGMLGSGASAAKNTATAAVKAAPGKAMSAVRGAPGAVRRYAGPAAQAGSMGMGGAAAYSALNAANSVDEMATSLPNQLAETANAFRGDFAQHASDLRGQLSEATKPFSDIGDALRPFSGMASGISNFVKSNPWLLPMLAGGVGGGLLGGRSGATLGGIGAPLAYLAATGQLGQLGGLGEHFKGLMGQRPSVDPAAGMAAATGGGAKQLQTQPAASAVPQPSLAPQRSELTANQM